MTGDFMIGLLLMLLMAAWIADRLLHLLVRLYNRLRADTLLDRIRTREELLYLSFKDFRRVVIEVLKRKGYSVKITDRCGEEGNGLLLDNRKYAEIWKHGLNHIVEPEAAMKLEKCMRSNSIHRGMFITLGDFKPATRLFCHKNVIECINGGQLLAMCREVQKEKRAQEAPV